MKVVKIKEQYEVAKNEFSECIAKNFIFSRINHKMDEYGQNAYEKIDLSTFDKDCTMITNPELEEMLKKINYRTSKNLYDRDFFVTKTCFFRHLSYR